MTSKSDQVNESRGNSNNFFEESKKDRGVVKHALLKYYLGAYLPIMAQQGDWINKIIYIDGFAGPGYHENGDKGSPIVAYETAVNHKLKENFKVEIIMIFIEPNEKYNNNLIENLKKTEMDNKCDKVSWDVRQGLFEDEIEDILKAYGEDNTNAFLAFVDPFGYKGVPMEVLQRLVQRYLTDVFINVMYGYANRWFKSRNPKTQEQLSDWIGMEGSKWKHIVFHDDNKTPTSRMNSFFDLYIQQLASTSEMKRYHVKFSIRNKINRHIYSLVFINGHQMGYRKMKEAMWRNSQIDDHFEFSEFKEDEQGTLNKKTKPEIAQDIFNQILAKYSGRKNVYGVLIDDYIWDETPYISNFKKELKELLYKYRNTEAESQLNKDSDHTEKTFLVRVPQEFCESSSPFKKLKVLKSPVKNKNGSPCKKVGLENSVYDFPNME